MNSVDQHTQKGLYFLPLGGTGEIGMNLNLFCCNGRWVMVDLGITFPNSQSETDKPIDVIMPDPEFITQRLEQLDALVITHGHEDHIGAIPYLWRRLSVPIYATRFTLALIREKLQRVGLQDQVPLHEVLPHQPLMIGAFSFTYLPITHSIPESHALLIKTPFGNIFHTGDWKKDDNPVVGEGFDERQFQSLAKEPILAMLSDSTNALLPGQSGSESSVYPSLLEIVKTSKQRVCVTSFASNVARLVTLFRIAAETGRWICLVGPALERMYRIAKQQGWLKGLPDVVSVRDAGYLPGEDVLIACTGSQGEKRSALSKLASGVHREVELEAGDCVVFSSRDIPGNEQDIERVKTQLRRRDIQVITEDEHHVHVSGHPCQDELRWMYEKIQPRFVLPVHGEPRHLRENAKIADQISNVAGLVVANGDLVSLSCGGAHILQQVPTGRLAFGQRQIFKLSSQDSVAAMSFVD